jgi:PIN domain nuclease of toxin-antitoxin system
MYVTDAHALLWHLSHDSALSAPAADLFQQADMGTVEIVIPGIVLVEVVYLCERRRVPEDRIGRILALPGMPGSHYHIAPLDEPVVQALRRIPRNQVSDMPDRIIGATTLHLGLPLITCDDSLTHSGLLTCMW